MLKGAIPGMLGWIRQHTRVPEDYKSGKRYHQDYMLEGIACRSSGCNMVKGAANITTPGVLRWIRQHTHVPEDYKSGKGRKLHQDYIFQGIACHSSSCNMANGAPNITTCSRVLGKASLRSTFSSKDST